MKSFSFVLIFFYFLTVVNCLTTIINSESESDDCLRGPTYWCHNFSTAVKCNTHKYCIQSVWENQRSSVKDRECQICEKEIQNLREILTSNTTKQVIEESLDYICELTVFTRIVLRQCEEIIHEYIFSNIDELLDMLRSNIDNKVICEKLDFCAMAKLHAEVTEQDEVVVHFQNIILHLPSSLMTLPELTSPLLGSRKCTWGPSYWCSNITSSRECKSTSHCIESVWNETTFVEDNDNICQICKEMVKEARDQLLSNETQTELKQVLEGSCKLIPLKTVRKECITLADEFIPELTEMLASQMNPTAVCTVSGLCNSPRIDDLLANSADNKIVFDECTNCTVAFTAVEKYFKTSPKEDFMNKLLLLCGQLSSYSDSCNAIVVEYFDDIFKTLSNEVHPSTACHLSGMCANKYHFHSDAASVHLEKTSEKLMASDDLSCDLCKQLVHHFKEILIANTTKEEFLQVLEGVCKQTGNFKNECLSLVKDNYKLIYDFITQELDPVKICTELTLCKRSNVITDDNLNLIGSPIVLLYTNTQNISDIITKNLSVADENTLDVSSSSSCEFCKMIVKAIQGLLDRPNIDDDIKKSTEEVCSVLPFKKFECRKFIDEYGDALIKILADETDPGIVCDTLRICSDIRKNESNKESVNLCPYCEYILHFIQNELAKPDTEKNIEKKVKNICNLVPKSEENQCKEFISQYAALIIAVLSEEIDPSIVCPAIKLCPSLFSGQIKCDYCNNILNKFIKSLNENHEEKNVVQQLTTFVSTVPKNLKQVALELKVNHYDDIIDMMLAEFDSQESCLFLHFCDAEQLEGKLNRSIQTN